MSGFALTNRRSVIVAVMHAIVAIRSTIVTNVMPVIDSSRDMITAIHAAIDP